ncbi:MAG: hypothetical protein A2148_00320 [Chloroflexi bacterium RBG_16_68_14]|nr:MAG: hypothetical protein A2148_00320 [Chloroflexi bacterium RBG_16_68_14]
MAAQERALRRGALRIFAETEEGALLRVALDVVSSLLRVDVVALYLPADGSGGPSCRAVWRQGSSRLLPPNETPVDLLAADVLRRRAPRLCGPWSPAGGAQCVSALAVPLEFQGTALGVLIVGRRTPDPFRDDHISLVCAAGQQLALALLRLRAAERLRTELVSMACHEIRTPLSALQGFTELMLSRDVPPSDQRDWLNLMHQEAVRLATLVEEMLDMTRVESGTVRLNVALVQVCEVAARVVRLLDGDGRRVHLVIERAPTVLADGDKLAQVVTNLLRNALDYSPPERAVEVEVARRCLGTEGGEAGTDAAHDCRPAVSVAVRDEGIGMMPEELGRAFQPFFRAGASRELLPEGSGLGLAIAKAIVERHRGRLWAHSQPGQGSTFGFCLPAQAPPPAEGAA